MIKNSITKLYKNYNTKQHTFFINVTNYHSSTKRNRTVDPTDFINGNVRPKANEVLANEKDGRPDRKDDSNSDFSDKNIGITMQTLSEREEKLRKGEPVIHPLDEKLTGGKHVTP